MKKWYRLIPKYTRALLVRAGGTSHRASHNTTELSSLITEIPGTNVHDLRTQLLLATTRRAARSAQLHQRPTYGMELISKDAESYGILLPECGGTSGLTHLIMQQSPQVFEEDSVDVESAVEPYPWSADRAESRAAVREYLERFEDANR